VNIAHFFTIIRIFIAPFFPLIYLHPEWFHLALPYMPYVLLAILIVCEVTDLIDGYLARSRKLVSDLGKVLDPMADSITRMLILFSFTQGPVGVSILLIFVFLYREFIISTLRTICALRGYALAARKSGKIKAIFLAVVNFFVVILLIFYQLNWIELPTYQWICFSVIALAAAYSVITAVEYIYVNREHVKKILSNPSP